ncbi:transposase [Sphingobacterium faecium]
MASTIPLHHKNIRNYFDNKIGHASVESFHARIKNLKKPIYRRG